MKKILSGLVLSVFVLSVLAAAAPLPNTTITLAQGLPDTMNIGELATVRVQATSDRQFLFAQALPSFEYVGKGVVAIQGGDHQGRGTSATLQITFQAKSSTTKMPGGVAPVHVVVGVRYPGGYVAVQDYLFHVAVP